MEVQRQAAAGDTDVLVIGAGIIGIACAWSIKQHSPGTRVTLIDAAQPMALTSAASGENYRNWWPHPVMKHFMEDSIDRVETLVRASAGRINLNRRGYVIASRDNDIESLLDELAGTFSDSSAAGLRFHDGSGAATYERPGIDDWRSAPAGVDVLTGAALVHRHFPDFDPAIQSVVHIRRAGTVASQPMGQMMLEQFRQSGGHRLQAEVVAVERSNGFIVSVQAGGQGSGQRSGQGSEQSSPVRARRIVNAAGPFAGEVAALLGASLPVFQVLQQKIAFEDTARAIPRHTPFCIDRDNQLLDWTEEERELLQEDPDLARFTQLMPGATHCRPDGGDHGTWIRLGWAYNDTPASPSRAPELDDVFPQIVLRGAARLHPALKAYDSAFPRNMTHYGGYYSMTQENWPLIGPLGQADTYVAAAMSGFGTMAACAAGDLTARWVLDLPRPAYAAALSLQRQDDHELMAALAAQQSRGLL